MNNKVQFLLLAGSIIISTNYVYGSMGQYDTENIIDFTDRDLVKITILYDNYVHAA